MVVKVVDVIVAEGTEAECAMYTGILLDLFRQLSEKKAAETAQRELNLVRKFKSMTIEDLIKSENSTEEENEG